MYSVRLCDVAPDGTMALVSKGALNVARRSSLSSPEPLQAALVYRFEIELNATAWRFDPGHRILVQISNVEFPSLLADPGTCRRPRASRRRTSSCLVLPTVAIGDPTSSASMLAPAEQADAGEVCSVLQNAYQDIDELLLDNAIEAKSGYSKSCPDARRHRVADVRDLSIWANNSDPSRARATGMAEITLRRGDWSVVTKAESSVTSTHDTFNVTQHLSVWLNGALHHQRRWAESIPRELM